jgi:RNA polymerase sigma factor (sigma-70 family)
MAGAPFDSAALYAACRSAGSDGQFDAFAQLGEYMYCVAYAMLHERPGGGDMAGDCMQQALIKVYQNLDQCRDPDSFRAWAASILRRTVLDHLRQPAVARVELFPDDHELPPAAIVAAPAEPDELGAILRAAIAHGPLSDRSRRVVVGRFFEERDDADLARIESDLASQTVLPSHIQVTRAKNLAKLRADAQLVAQVRAFLPGGEE